MLNHGCNSSGIVILTFAFWLKSNPSKRLFNYSHTILSCLLLFPLPSICRGNCLFSTKRNWNIHWNAVSTQSIDNACTLLCKPRYEITLPINNWYTLHSIVYTRAHPYFIIDYFFSHTQLCIPRYHSDVPMNVPIAFEVNKHLPPRYQSTRPIDNSYILTHTHTH